MRAFSTPKKGDPGSSSLFSLLCGGRSTQIVMVTRLVIFDVSFVAAAVNNPGQQRLDYATEFRSGGEK